MCMVPHISPHTLPPLGWLTGLIGRRGRMFGILRGRGLRFFAIVLVVCDAGIGGTGWWGGRWGCFVGGF